VFSGRHVPDGELHEIANGHVLVPNGQRGVFISENPDSPWHHATFFAHGTTVKDGPDGKALWDISILEAVDPDGDVTWAIIAQEYAKPPYDFYFIGGTGKWYGITGEGEATGMVRDRVDHYNMPTWKISWKVVREE
jgi:hypothetical protein